jgi:hypothetical protein
MASLNELEQYILYYPGTTLTEMMEDGNPLVSSITESNNYPVMNLFYDKALGIGGFWWGCVLGPVGILAVYLITGDKDQTLSAAYGCSVTVAIAAIIAGGSSYW